MRAPEAVEDDAGLGDAAISEEVGHGGKYSTRLDVAVGGGVG